MTKIAAALMANAASAMTMKIHFHEVYSAMKPPSRFPQTAPTGAPAAVFVPDQHSTCLTMTQLGKVSYNNN